MNEQDFNKYRVLTRIAHKNYGEKWLSDSNIAGFAYGQKIVHRQSTDEPAVVVYVKKKIARAFLPLSRLLPRKIYIGGDCIQVDIIETGPFYPLAFTTRDRPAPSGISIGHFLITAGTLGCLVTDLSDGTLCILSNNHVLANENMGAFGDALIQPGSFDGGVVATDTIASLKRFEIINPTGNIIDAAIGQVINRADVINEMKNNLMPVPSPDHPAVGLLFAGSCNRTIMNPIRRVLGIMNIDFLNGGPNAVVDATIGMNVEKVGRTTEYTTSTVQEIDATVSVGYSNFTATFDHQITTMWMSEGGDSGSVVCRGGEGGKEDHCNGGGCASSSVVSSILQRDIKQDVAFEKIFRDKYLLKTMLGKYLVDLYFNNEDYIVSRINKVKANKEDVSYIQYLYDKFAQRVRSMAINPDSAERLNADIFAEAKQAIRRFREYLNKDEQQAADQLFELAQSFEGKSVKEALEMFNDKKLYNDVVKIISGIEAFKKKDC